MGFMLGSRGLLNFLLGQLLGIKKTDEVSNITGWLKTFYSLDAYVHNWVNWLQHESDHKPL
jgi:hypothetical protein